MTATIAAAQTAGRVISDKYRPQYPDDLPALERALRGALSGTSDTVVAYEQALAAWFGAAEAITVSSGGAAVSVALFAAGVQPGDDVLLTPSCPLCTVYPIIAAGANPVFVDTREHGFGADPDSVRERVTPRASALIDIPMWGYPTEVDELRGLADSLDLKLILDLAHSHGSTLHGRHLSSYGHLSCFSTHERKPLATGEGGFLLTDDAELAERCRSYSRFGNLNGADFGLNYKLAALPAALGHSRLDKLAGQIDRRRTHARHLLQRLRHPQVREKRIIEGGNPNYYFLNLELGFADNRAFIDYLDARGIPSDIKRYGCQALYRFPALEQYRRDCPNAEALLSGMTTLPVHPALGEEELDYMADVINGYQAP
ncbi:aspartate aminotransferase [Chromobacterium violaceum]|uniref:DegT/DnrJ/EryC1/StrS family aminotransferase n=1 Tax=Chromobacterium violaceum TaxID=536 RepID=UPI0006532A17|nr:DegT/DnrJ/EryC1/StrS family aminotransferase [Chromobacterium violaceum]KMN48359.1 aspartate aminotransferase [Chromobacterium violaceum]KMN88410.1 aspartate aminotransferase [Chromobacterium violaceum]KMO02747.1 aspartate aminotransferase [Chromobacterium violaceum]